RMARVSLEKRRTVENRRRTGVSFSLWCLKDESLVRGRPIAHAELRAKMLAEQIDGLNVRLGVRLNKVGNSLDEQLLPLHITRIGATGLAGLGVRHFWDGEYLGLGSRLLHACPHNELVTAHAFRCP